MGGEQSCGRRAGHPEEQERGEERSANQHQEPSTTNGPEPAVPQETPGELPQCQMGNRKVDNMSFMISCTNWY